MKPSIGCIYQTILTKEEKAEGKPIISWSIIDENTVYSGYLHTVCLYCKKKEYFSKKQTAATSKKLISKSLEDLNWVFLMNTIIGQDENK